MSKIIIRTPYNDPYVDIGLQCVTLDGEPEVSLTKQSEKDNTDINLIVKQFERSGILPVMNQTPVFADVSEVTSYQESLAVVQKAELMFNALPAEIRKQFGNSPAAFLDFVNDPANGQKLIDMGLREAPISNEGAKPSSEE